MLPLLQCNRQHSEVCEAAGKRLARQRSQVDPFGTEGEAGASGEWLLMSCWQGPGPADEGCRASDVRGGATSKRCSMPPSSCMRPRVMAQVASEEWVRRLKKVIVKNKVRPPAHYGAAATTASVSRQEPVLRMTVLQHLADWVPPSLPHLHPQLTGPALLPRSRCSPPSCRSTSSSCVPWLQSSAASKVSMPPRGCDDDATTMWR